ncbi:hypothetical protein SAMN03159496_06664 [Rhizobium sp. NFR07]|uniref:hypothetical protein n=1 Tax=Rhizobium sp. NFR07 TaxID=1566262 RepID=UPI0008E99673|nr:hypothetical protein [Rhizobium sp. NFR07]SFB65175.1 hypothetical protein SAMN03159496_06664 [Rhizobium sp. NFR07]
MASTDQFSSNFVSLASSAMVRKALQSHPSRQPPPNDGDFAALLTRLSEAEKTRDQDR